MLGIDSLWYLGNSSQKEMSYTSTEVWMWLVVTYTYRSLLRSVTPLLFGKQCVCSTGWIRRYQALLGLQMLALWASYQIRKIAGCACAGNVGIVFPHRRFHRKPLVSDPDMHHGTCVTHVPWCMSGSLTCGDGENVPGIPGACAPAILRIWQEAHRDYGIPFL